jgi:hypothetical protein
MDWTIATQFGVPFMMLCAGGLFFYKSVWPFMMRQFETAQAASEKAQRDFLTQLDKRDLIAGKQTEAIERLTEEVRRIK